MTTPFHVRPYDDEHVKQATVLVYVAQSLDSYTLLPLAEHEPIQIKEKMIILPATIAQRVGISRVKKEAIGTVSASPKSYNLFFADNEAHAYTFLRTLCQNVLADDAQQQAIINAHTNRVQGLLDAMPNTNNA